MRTLYGPAAHPVSREADSLTAMRRTPAVVVSIAFAIAVLSPLFRSPPRDSYPLSNYPMFSQRLEAENEVRTAVGHTASGDRRLLSPRLISGSDEVMQAVQDVGDAVRAGEAADLCRAIASRVAESGRSELVQVAVVTELHNSVEYFRGAEDPLATTVHAECPVPS